MRPGCRWLRAAGRDGSTRAPVPATRAGLGLAAAASNTGQRLRRGGKGNPNPGERGGRCSLDAAFERHGGHCHLHYTAQPGRKTSPTIGVPRDGFPPRPRCPPAAVTHLGAARGGGVAAGRSGAVAGGCRSPSRGNVEPVAGSAVPTPRVLPARPC